MPDIYKAAQQALDALEEATTYTGSASWSPSMTIECIKAADDLRAALEQPLKLERNCEMTDIYKAAQQALDALKIATNMLDNHFSIISGGIAHEDIKEAFVSLGAALKQQQQEPAVEIGKELK